MGGAETLVLKDGLYVHTRLAGVGEELDVGVSRVAESQ